MTVLPSAVLFCCTMNEIRSPMAEGIMKRFHGTRVFVDSAGVHLGKLDPFMVEVMAEIGVDMSRHKPKVFETLEDDSFDMIIALSPHAQHKAVDLTRFMSCEARFWNIFDPSLVEGTRDARLAAYRQVRDQLQQKILDLFPRPSDDAF
ncbi:MAG: arsenate reductase ArsC [Rhodospirillaceae bacterium]|nr:MAG: arsenate reductase ArsC [Rhodospirillaceae bacterium]